MSLDSGDRSLAQDRDLIDGLAQKSDELLASLAGVTPALQQLTTETAKMNLMFRNVVGDLNALSEKRFIENRVEVVHEKKLSPEPVTQEPRQATEEELREAVRIGLRSFGLLPAGELTDTETGYECFLRERPFSLIIGSPRWLAEDHLGGTEKPSKSGSLEESLLSEAIEDLVSPVSPMYDIEEAAEAEEWFGQKERASVVSTPGSNLANDSSSISSASEISRSSLPAAITAETIGVKNSLQGGLFDEDNDDDGDFFGTIRKPSLTPEIVSQQAKPVAHSEKVTPSPYKPEPRPTTSAETVQASFLEELKTKTKQRTAVLRDSKKDDSEGEQRLNQTKAKAFHEQNHLHNLDGGTLPDPSRSSTVERTKPAEKTKHGSLFDGDSDSDFLESGGRLTRPPPVEAPTGVSAQPPPQSRIVSVVDSDQESDRITAPPLLHPSTPTLFKGAGGKRHSISQSKGLSKRGFLFDSDSDSEPGIFSSLPAKDASNKVTPTSLRPKSVAEALSIPRKLISGVGFPPLQTELAQEHGDSDKDIFGHTPTATQRSASSQISELPRLPLEFEGTKEPAAEFPSRGHIPKVLVSIVRPPSSDSDEEVVTRIPPKVSGKFSDRKQLPPKTTKLFDSDSDDSLFGGPVSIRTASAATSSRKTVHAKETSQSDQGQLENSATDLSVEQRVKSTTAETVVKDAAVEKDTTENQENMLQRTDKKAFVKKIGMDLPPGLLQGRKQKQQEQDMSAGYLNATSSTSDGEGHPKAFTTDSAHGKDTDPFVKAAAKSVSAERFKSPIETDKLCPLAVKPKSFIIGESELPTVEQTTTPINKQTKAPHDDPVKSPMDARVKLPLARKTIIPVEDKPEDGTQSSPAKETKSNVVSTVPTEGEEQANAPFDSVEHESAPKETSKVDPVRKIGVGLSASLLQGLKMKQQQLGIVSPELTSHSSDSDGETRLKAISANSLSIQQDPGSPSKERDAGKVIENKGLINITKSRAKGPTGRRLPSRTKGQAPLRPAGEALEKPNKSEGTNKANNSAVPTTGSVSIKTETVKDRVDGHAGLDILTRDLEDLSNKIISPQKQIQAAVATAQTNQTEQTIDHDASTSTSGNPVDEPKERGKMAKAVGRESVELFSTDSDDDLFAPKLSRQKRISARDLSTKATITKKATTSTTSIAVNDPLLALSASDTGMTTDEFTTEKAFSLPTEEKAPAIRAGALRNKSQVNTPAKNDPFEDSDDSEDLFGSRRVLSGASAVPMSKSTSSFISQDVGKAKTVTKDSRSKTGGKLFDSDSDSDDLFRK
ncbi:hypothetical protein BIW11_05049 [Tropilaelaps mercedesae]|uniref:Uncharacterized protein n=1 Tax=Tropilaelaps mercedesae TaxID=418985 RepID=A0A1V9WY36_9ACAR|nr:hypothetical protein BIW11_05049 [Tropilaelaps mercedesae]